MDNRDRQPAPPADGTVVTTNGAAGDNTADSAEPDGDGTALPQPATALPPRRPRTDLPPQAPWTWLTTTM